MVRMPACQHGIMTVGCEQQAPAVTDGGAYGIGHAFVNIGGIIDQLKRNRHLVFGLDRLYGDLFCRGIGERHVEQLHFDHGLRC